MTTITYPPIIAKLGGAESIAHDGFIATVMRYGVAFTIPWERIAPFADDGLAVWCAVELERRTKAQKRAKAAPMTVCRRCLAAVAVRDVRHKRCQACGLAWVPA